MPVYIVELKVECLVEADHELDAMAVAELNARDIVYETDPEADSAFLVKSLASLPPGYSRGESAWTRHGGGKLLTEILPEEDPFVDTRTIDMFTGQPNSRAA